MTNLCQYFLLDTPDGKLEVCLEKPAVSELLAGISVICHPHPLYGGSMENKVVTTTAKAFREKNIASVKFNYRGVGQSEGQYDKTIGETKDALNILHWTASTFPDQKIFLAGFSFGAYISLQAAIQSNLKISHLFSIAPPVNHVDFTNLHPRCPWTVLIAENDAIVPAKMIMDWIAVLDPAPEILFFPESSHFFDGQLIDLKNKIKSVKL